MIEMEIGDIRRKLRALSKKYSLEIIASLFKGSKKYVSQLAEELGAPYTTILQRVAELERAGLINCSETLHPLSRRPIKEAEIVNFQILLNPLSVQQIVAKEWGGAGFKVWVGQKKEDVATISNGKDIE